MQYKREKSEHCVFEKVKLCKSASDYIVLGMSSGSDLFRGAIPPLPGGEEGRISAAIAYLACSRRVTSSAPLTMVLVDNTVRIVYRIKSSHHQNDSTNGLKKNRVDIWYFWNKIMAITLSDRKRMKSGNLPGFLYWDFLPYTGQKKLWSSTYHKTLLRREQQINNRVLALTRSCVSYGKPTPTGRLPPLAFVTQSRRKEAKCTNQDQERGQSGGGGNGVAMVWDLKLRFMSG